MNILKHIDISQKNIFWQSIVLILASSLSSLSFNGNLIFVPLTILALNILFNLISDNNCNLIKSCYFGFLFSFFMLFFGLCWISISFEVGNAGGILIGLLAVLLLCIFLSFFTVIFIVISKFLYSYWNLNLLGFAIICSVFISFSEYIRGIFLGGFPWNTLGYIWSGSYIFLQPVSLIGIYGLGLFSFLAIFSISLFRVKIHYGLYALMPLLILFVYGLIRSELRDQENYFSESIRLVQPNIKQQEKWDTKLHKQHLDKLINLSQVDIKNDYPKYIIWPESAFMYDIDYLNKNNINLFKWLKDKQLVITGATRRVYKNDELFKIYNSIYFINNKGSIINYYDKVKLVPFGEFNPFSKIIKFIRLANGAIDFSAGKLSNTIDLGKNYNKIGALICYEIIFSSKVVNGDRPDFLINLTNDAWYKKSHGPIQHLAAARVRAIEEGLPVLRVANTGISAIINPLGVYIKKLPLETQGFIDSKLPKLYKPTLFSIYGNIIYIIISLIMLFISKFLFLRKGKYKEKI